jgi:TonB family protein
MTAITHALSAALLHFVWQALPVTVLLWLALWLLRKRSAALRYIVCCAALALLAAFPVVTTLMLYKRPSATPFGLNMAIGSIQFDPSAPTQPAGWFPLVQDWAVPIWAFGVLLLSVRMAWGCTRIAALRRAGEAAGAELCSTVTAMARRMGVTRPVRILLSYVTDSPSVTGWLRPVLLLPVCAISGLTPEQLEAVLAHELAHIRRHDYLVNLLQMAAETLLFYHPAVWWISTRIRHERELCCDDVAVRATGGALSYARALTALEKLRAARPVLALRSTDGPLFLRIRGLVAGGGEYGPSKLSGAVALALALIGGTLTMNWSHAQEPPQHAPGVSVDTGGAALLHGREVRYPEELRSKGVRGTVALEATIDKAGQVVDARVLSGPTELRKAALSAVLDWHFAPSGGTTRNIAITFVPPLNVPGIDLPDIELGDIMIVVDQRDGSKKVFKLQDEAGDGEIHFESIEREDGQSPGPLTAIRIGDLSAPATADLRSRLPVHEGDMLTPELLEATRRAVREFDEHLYTDISRETKGTVLVIRPSEGSER